MPESFQALVADNTGTFTVQVKQLSIHDLPEGEVLVQVAYSSVNYKDALACSPDGKVVSSYPFVPGIDLSGVVVSSSDSRFKPGQPVLATGYQLGVTHYGGFSEYARVHADWLVPLPAGLSLKEAMIYGTAGFTAALSIERLEENGMSPDKGSVLVTGATGGVGGAAIAILHRKGYHVVASTGDPEAAAEYLTALGADEIVSRGDINAIPAKPLNKQRWQAAVDSVGGSSLAAILSSISYGGSVAASGLTGGTAVPATVMPFILRGVSLLGIDSVFCPASRRLKLWERMAGDWKPGRLELLVDREISLRQLPQALADITQSRTLGRIVVRLGGG
ncbi:acryloyl-CoA reductase [Paenibacillus nanensis]|uniref:Acryloyl-CoA reductase n=1 Tax=Paenibacillus nanensis TaxID=393251 RepID=A0A3A1V469_9BACL|nr:acryloyl-CoA reductase [Paenibacillus nanensis]RIX54182.1 acryloyl-CoA reductase [Paenibacillus nanensis]